MALLTAIIASYWLLIAKNHCHWSCHPHNHNGIRHHCLHDHLLFPELYHHGNCTRNITFIFWANDLNCAWRPLREKCPNTELFLVRIQSEYRKIRIRNNSVFGHFHAMDIYRSNYLILNVLFSRTQPQILGWKFEGFAIVALFHILQM